MPSEWYEPFGMVLVEAMSAGLPIIVTTTAAARDIVGPGAIVVPPHRPDAIAAAISALDDATVDELGALNRRRFEECYTRGRRPRRTRIAVRLGDERRSIDERPS